MNRLIVLIRHGETTHSKDGKFQSIDSVLTSESKKTALNFSRFIKKIEPSMVIQSTLKRSIETVNLLVGDTKTSVITNRLFDEIREPKSICGKNISTKLSFLDKAVSKYDSEPNFKIEDSESLSEFITRVKEAQNFLLKSSDRKIIISSHGFFMRIFLLLSLFSPENINSELIRAVKDRVLIGKLNCSLFCVKGSNLVLEKWNTSLDELAKLIK